MKSQGEVGAGEGVGVEEGIGIGIVMEGQEIQEKDAGGVEIRTPNPSRSAPHSHFEGMN